ncbi:hypothetical protein BTUL_0007g01230 [Botrytis tulipae]|uniref:Ketoreductase (KR) domain-containing protein n=1 Tax=Botrytis tulipae TaxID=87230 RepID=A0A4Z1F2R5_9HELO|nr:hypothetical protein BTUL_0007g01230 [Botrytis tulipae]
MSSYDSIRAFARRVESQLTRIDIVIFNAGMIKHKFVIVEDTGHEESLQVNYLFTMFLSILLFPILKAKGPPSGEPAHLTILSAALALAAKFSNQAANPLLAYFDNPKTFDGRELYHTSQLLAHIFLWNLVDYVSAKDVIVNLAGPAWCRGTGLGRDAEEAMKVFMKLFGLLGGTPKVGASCFVDEIRPFTKVPRSLTTLLYTPEGKELTQCVWEETLAELQFAGVRDIFESMKRR